MPDKTTTADLFDLAITAEETIELLYRGFEAKFADHPDVANFWARYAAEEAGHAEWLRRCRGTSNPEQLTEAADPRILQSARWVERFSVDETLGQIGNLQDAYELAHELEYAETNLVFEFLITSYSDQKTVAFLRAQLGTHTGRLEHEFPERFGSPAVRQAVKVLS